MPTGKIYSVINARINAGKKYFKKVEHLTPVSPMSYIPVGLRNLVLKKKKKKKKKKF